MIPHITEEDIRKKVSMPQAIALMKEAFVQLSNHKAVIPVRTVIPTFNQDGRVLFMPSYSPVFNLFGLKMVSVFNKNASEGLPVIQGNMLIMDGKNGSPLATMDAEYLTALRTGAASGLATDLLSRKDSTVLAVFGTGKQAETQVEGVLAVRSIKNVLVFGRDVEKTKSFCERIRNRCSAEAEPATSPAQLKQADVICTATTSSTPVFESHQLKAGVHINGVGSFTSAMQEIPEDVIKRSWLVVDQYETALKEAGDIVIAIQKGEINQNHLRAELGEILLGRNAGRTLHDQITIFKSVGNAIQDLAIASFLLK
jgi:ornithine cyclodeaminase/alanine dehydrogenase-like protein (mu-crystallin family)